jgi:hypothetical protein
MIKIPIKVQEIAVFDELVEDSHRENLFMLLTLICQNTTVPKLRHKLKIKLTAFITNRVILVLINKTKEDNLKKGN